MWSQTASQHVQVCNQVVCAQRISAAEGWDEKARCDAPLFVLPSSPARGRVPGHPGLAGPVPAARFGRKRILYIVRADLYIVPTTVCLWFPF